MSDILRWEKRKTRKPHRCYGCQEIYPTGTRMVNAAYADSGEVYSCFWCETCLTVMEKHRSDAGPGAEYGRGEVKEYDDWQTVHDEICSEKEVPRDAR